MAFCLPEVSADAIAKVLRELVGNPSRLRDSPPGRVWMQNSG